MDKIVNALYELYKLNESYSLSNDKIEQALSDAGSAKVCTPVIGRFSSGKSALINTLLGYTKKLLREDITPETAVPAELTYSPDGDCACVVKNDGITENITLMEFRELETDANTVKCVRLELKNRVLEEIPDVMLVDMPGFESGFEVHNRAIDGYLPSSLAYIIAFPADDMIVRSSIGNILKELCIYDMPVCVVITKYDKRNDDFEKTFEALKENLKRFIGNREITYCITSRNDGNVEELKEFLIGIQEDSQEILARKFKTVVLSCADATENYLQATLKGSGLSESELDEQEAKLKEKLDSLDQRFSSEKDNFGLQVSECVEEIKNDVLHALEAEESSFVVMAINNQSLNERINVVVRTAVAASVKKRFVPKVEKYLKRAENCMNDISADGVQISFSFDTDGTNGGFGQAIATGTAAGAAASAGAAIAGPIIAGVIVGIIALVSKLRSDRKREELKSQIRMKLRSEVFPQVLREVGHSVEIAITKQINMINSSIEGEIKTQKSALDKAMEDIRKKISDERQQKESLEQQIREDLDRIKAIRDDVQ